MLLQAFHSGTPELPFTGPKVNLMKNKVFYSWQSDLPNGTKCSFIEAALRKAAEEVANDDTVDVEPVIDRDTAGIAGSPDISSTIFAKIREAHVFVADVSIINANAKAAIQAMEEQKGNQLSAILRRWQLAKARFFRTP